MCVLLHFIPIYLFITYTARGMHKVPCRSARRAVHRGLLHGSNGGNGGPWNFDQSIIACENHRRRGKEAYPKNSKCSDGQLVAKMAAKLMFRLLSKYLPLNLWSGLVGMTLLGMLLDVLPFFTLPSPRKRAFRASFSRMTFISISFILSSLSILRRRVSMSSLNSLIRISRRCAHLTKNF